MFVARKFIQEMENITVYVAADRIGKPLLGEIINATINGDEDNEELKLKILNAINYDL